MKAKAMRGFSFGLQKVKEGQEIEVNETQAAYLIPRGFVQVPGVTAAPQVPKAPAPAKQPGDKSKHHRRKK